VRSSRASSAACFLALGLTGCPADPAPAPQPSASSTPAATPALLTNAVLLGTWIDAERDRFTFRFTEDSFVIETGGAETPLRYEVVEATADTITIVTHEELLGTDETRDTRLTYRPLGSHTLERLATEGIGAGKLTRQVR